MNTFWVGGETWAVTAPDCTQGLLRTAFIQARPSDEAFPVTVDLGPDRTHGEATLQRRRGREIMHVTPYATYRYNGQTAHVTLHGEAALGQLFGTNVLFRIVAWRAVDRGLLPLHAAVLGGQLIPAAPGAGKSVATALGVSAGLPTLGDDVVVWDPNTDVMHAVYRTLRLTQAGLELVAPFLDGLQVLGERHDGKRILITEPGPARPLSSLLLIDQPATPAAAFAALTSTFSLLHTAGVRPPPGILADLTRRAHLRAVRRRNDLLDWQQTLLAVCGD